MSTDDYDDEEFEDFEDEDDEEWEYVDDEIEKERLRDRVSIKDIIKLVMLFVFFTAFFLFFKYWNVFVDLFTVGNEKLAFGESRLIYLTLMLFPFLAAIFIVFLVQVSKTLFIPKKKAAVED
ncbi:MAG: hypothetical protein ACTSO7_14340 [Candidatus Heimdallarchaeota archaeon]